MSHSYLVYKPYVPVPPAPPSMDILPLTLIICYFRTGVLIQGEHDLYVCSGIPRFNAFKQAYKGEAVQTIINKEGKLNV